MPEWISRPEFIWFVIGLALLLVEFAVPALIIFFFGLGAWIVAIACLMAGFGLTVQLALFLVTSVLLLVLFRKRLRSLFYGEGSGFTNLADDIDDVRGRKVTVVREIRPNTRGKVELYGSEWEAESDVPLAVGTIVEIVEKDNLTLKVKPV